MHLSLAPATRDRMAGRYFDQCPACRTHRCLGQDCAGSGPVPARRRRRVERRALEQYVRDELGTAPRDLLVDESDCGHGCSGHPSCCGRCTFTCHRPATDPGVPQSENTGRRP